jgi:hypothetical protein
MKADMGASATPSGSREPSPAVSAASGFDPSRIASGLTKEQRLAVLALGPSPSRLGVPRGKSAKRLLAMNACRFPLFEKKWAGDANRHFLTPLGMAVRAHLRPTQMEGSHD